MSSVVNEKSKSACALVKFDFCIHYPSAEAIDILEYSSEPRLLQRDLIRLIAFRHFHKGNNFCHFVCICSHQVTSEKVPTLKGKNLFQKG